MIRSVAFSSYMTDLVATTGSALIDYDNVSVPEESLVGNEQDAFRILIFGTSHVPVPFSRFDLARG